MNQEHRVDYNVVKRACDDIAFEMNLPMDRFAVRTRDNYIKAIYNSCYQCVTPYNEMAYKWVNSTITGNLASWYANEYSVYKNAPMEWQKDAKETIVGMFKEVYPEREDLKEDYEEYGLPTSFSVLLSDAEKAEMADSEDEEEFVSDYITNKYGFCHNGFTYEIVGDELIVNDVQWDIYEEDDDELDENLTQDSISGDTLMQEVYDFIISESNEDRLVPFDVVRNMMNERGLRLEDYFNDLLIREGQEGLLLKTIDGDQYIGPVSLLDKRSDEVAIVKKEEQKLEKSVNRLQDKIDGEIAAERKWLEDATYGDIDELVDNVKYIYVEAPRARKYQPLIRKLFGQDADKVHITKSDNPNAKWSISADIYIKDVDKLPAALKAKVNSNGTISSIGLAVELYRAGAKLSGSKEVKEGFGAHLLKETKGNSKKSVPEHLWSDVCSNRLDKVKAYFEQHKDLTNRRYNRFNMEHSLIMGALRNGNLEMVELLKSFGETILDNEQDEFDKLNLYYEENPQYVRQSKDGKSLKESSDKSKSKDKMYVGIWDDAQDDFVEYEEFNDFQDALEFASKYDYSKIKSGTVKFDTNSLFTKGFASEFDIVNGKTDLKAMQELMPKKDIEENFLSEAISSKDITDWCDTSEQEETLKLINRIAKRENVSLRLGTKVGKYPQSLIIDHDYQDNAIRIYPNGACIIKDKKFGDWRLDDFDVYEFKNDITNAIKEMITKKNNNSYVCKLVLMNSDIEEINNLLGSTARMQNWDTDQVVCDEECVFEDGTIGRLLVEIGEDEDETIKGVFELSTGDRKYFSDEIDKMHTIELNNYGKSYAISVDGGLSGDYYQNKKERESSKKLFGKKQVNESLHLTEGHDVQEYKGFELDLDTDLTNHNWEDEEYIITPTVEIKYNGKVLATANGYRAARAWIDKHVKIVPYSVEEKTKQLQKLFTDDGTYSDVLGGNLLLIYGQSENIEAYFYLKSLAEIYFGAELESLDEFLDFNSDVSIDQLLKKFPQISEDSWQNVVDITLDRPDDLHNPIIQKATSIRELVGNFDGGYSALTGLDYRRDKLFQNERVLIDGKEIDVILDDPQLKEFGIYNDTGHGLELEMVIKAKNKDEAYKIARDEGYGKYVRVEMMDESLKESYDDWEESGIYGGDLTYCPICDTRLKYDEDGDHYCPKCKEDAHSLSMKRRHMDKDRKNTTVIKEDKIDYKEIANRIRKNSDVFAVLSGWQYKNEPYVELYPEEHTEYSLKDRIKQIVSSYDKYSYNGNTGHRYAKQSDFHFDIMYK